MNNIGDFCSNIDNILKWATVSDDPESLFLFIEWVILQILFCFKVNAILLSSIVVSIIIIIIIIIIMIIIILLSL